MQRTTGGLAAPALAALLGLIGCGPSEQPTPPAPQPGEASPATPPPAAEPLRSAPPDPEVVGVETQLPADVPVPERAQAVHPAMRASGTTRASFAVADPVGSVHSFYKSRLAESGWSLAAEKELESQVLLSAKKDARELSVAMSEDQGQTQLVILIIGE